MDDIYSLDIETAPSTGKPPPGPYALEPYRLPQGLAKITCITIAGPDGEVTLDERSGNIPSIKAELQKLAGKTVVAQNAVFDAGWLIAQCGFDAVNNIKWRDTMLLGKWIENSQQPLSFSLIELVTRWLQDDDDFKHFDMIKHESVNPGENYQYWLERNILDARLTRKLFIKLWSHLPNSCKVGYVIEQGNIPHVARGWLTGFRLDKKGADELLPRVKAAQKKLCEAIGVSADVLGSPTQLGRLVFGTWGIRGLTKTKSGYSTNKDDLAKLCIMLKGTPEGAKLELIMKFKKLRTLETKYINGINRTIAYNLEPFSHASPRIFSTYTGRYTYSSSYTKMKGVPASSQPGIAAHQIPRDGPIRNLLQPPEGYVVAELDAAAQEMRAMAVMAGESTMIFNFNNGRDLHADMASDIAFVSYEEFVERYHNGDKQMENFRYAGKLLNLSCQYRIGFKSLMDKFFSTYSIIISAMESRDYLKKYLRKYPGVEQYWTDAINVARRKGYAESISGRRYYLTDWSGRSRYGTEQSAINFPIQGTGGDHKEVAITSLGRKFPEAILLLDLHDGLWYGLPEEGALELALEMQNHINQVNFSEVWNKEIAIPLPFDLKFGTTFGNVKEVR